MQTLDEGTLRLTFPAAWAVVLKYDDSPYYRGPVTRTATDAAAVDFVAWQPQTATLLLLEVKDFRQHSVENRPRLHSGELVQEATTKALDTLGLLHLGRRTGFAEVQALAAALDHTAPAKVHFVLLLEDDALPQPGASGHLSVRKAFRRDTYSKLRGDTLTALKTRLHPFRITVALYSCAEVPTREGWTAAPTG